MGVVLDNYSKKCKVTQGGVKRAFLFPYVKYSRALIKSDQMSLIEFPDSTVYQFDVKGSYDQSSNIEQGSFFFDQNISLRLSEVYDNIDIHDFLKIDYRVIVETYNNQLIIFGVRNGLTVRTTNTTGNEKNEFNGFTLNFTGQEEKSGLLISSLEDLGFTIFDDDDGGFFDYVLDLDLS